jgi:hypothetical protein
MTHLLVTEAKLAWTEDMFRAFEKMRQGSTDVAFDAFYLKEVEARAMVFRQAGVECG